MDLTPEPPLVQVIQDGEHPRIGEKQGPFQGGEAGSERQQEKGEYQRRYYLQCATEAATPQHAPRETSLPGRTAQEQPALEQKGFAEGEP